MGQQNKKQTEEGLTMNGKSILILAATVLVLAVVSGRAGHFGGHLLHGEGQ